MHARSLFVSLLAVVLATGGSPAGSDPAGEAGRDRAEALRNLRSDAHDGTVRTRADGIVSFFQGRVPGARFSRGGSADRTAADFLRAYGPAFGIEAADAAHLRTARDRLGMTHVRYEQRYRGLPVVGRQVIVHLIGDDVIAANGDAVGVTGVSTEPVLSAADARAAAAAALAGRRPRRASTPPELVVYVDGARTSHLAWGVTTPTDDPVGLWRSYVHATTGRILRAYDDLRYALDRDIFDMANDQDCNLEVAPACTLPGTLARGEGDPAIEPDVDAAYDRLGEAYDYFFNAFGIDSYDDAGHTIRASVNFGDGFPNAFWCPDECAVEYGSLVDGEQLVFGDGLPMVQDDDVVLHEFAHGVTDALVGFEGLDQSGALDEAYADLFAAFEGQDWVIGETAFPPSGLRDLTDPTLRGDPDHMSDYVKSFYDAGAVHANSTIVSHAGYLASEDATFGALGEATAEQIYFRALSAYLTPSADFLDNLNALIAAATDLHGAGSAEVAAIVEAHAAVGIVNAADLDAPVGGATLKGGAPTTVSWNAPGTDGLAFTAAFGRSSGSPVYQQAFEGTATPGGFVSSGDAPWAPTTTDVGSGKRSLRSGPIGDGERSVLSLTRTLLAPGTIEFLFRVSSEEFFDFFVFYIDGDFVGFDTGESGWALASADVPAGRHTFTWVYEKDEDGSDGLDGVFLDDLVITNTPKVTWTTIDTTAPDATGTPWTPPSTTGTNYRMRTRTDMAAIGFGEVIAGPFTVDATPPTGVKVTSGLKRFQVAGTKKKVSVRLPWTGRDAHTGIASFDLRWRSAGPNGSFSPYETLLARTTVRRQTVPFSGADLRGATLCFGARARDGVGNRSGYSAPRCTAVPLDNLQLGASTGWTTRTGKAGFYLKSFDQTKQRGAFLRSPRIKAKRIAVIATRCSSCGVIKVFRGSTLLKRVSLRAPTTKKRQVIMIKSFSSIRSKARITIRVVSSSKLVRIEGLGVSLG